MLAPDVKKAWPLDFALVYSVTLGRTSLETGLHVQNKSEKSAIEFQALFHNYLAIKVSTLNYTEDVFADEIKLLGHLPNHHHRPNPKTLYRQSPLCNPPH